MSDEHTTSLVKQLYDTYAKAQIDYTEQYLKLYISYNAWYRQVTKSMNDRSAINELKKRFVIWEDFRSGLIMKPLRPYMQCMAEMTQKEPFVSVLPFWNGELDTADDWQSMIEYWYQVRCLVVHGSPVRQKHAWLAYETLSIFMGEIVDRMQQRITRMSSVSAALGSHLPPPNVWQVDMQRVAPMQ